MPSNPGASSMTQVSLRARAHIGQQLLCLHEMALLPEDSCNTIGCVDVARVLVQHLHLASQTGVHRIDSQVDCWAGTAGITWRTDVLPQMCRMKQPVKELP